MEGIKHIFNKEMARIFRDKKMMFSVFILPVVIMIGIMSVMGVFIKNMTDDIKKHESIVYVENMAPGFEDFIKDDYQVKTIHDEKGRDRAEEEVLNGEADLLISFPEGFGEQITSYKEGDTVPVVDVRYNPSEDYSASAYAGMTGMVLESYRQTLLSERVGNLEQIAVFTVNQDEDEIVIQNDQKAQGKAVGMMLPYFITILLFAGAMGIGTDMIAGEKERGTIASLLVSPINRSSIVLGKVFSLMTISGISSIIYVGAMILCMPLMSNVMGGGRGLEFSLSGSQMAMTGALLVALAFLYSSVIALLSVFAKNTKEASTYVMPVYMVILVIGMSTMFSSGDISTTAYCIPFYNTAVALKSIFSLEITAVQFLITLGMTLLLGAVLTGVMVKAFESENVMAP